jgi:hypothetical protein
VRWKASSEWKKIDRVTDYSRCIQLRTTAEEEEAINCGHPIGEPLYLNGHTASDRNSNLSILIYFSHLKSVLMPILEVVLIYEKAVNPDISITQSLCDFKRIDEYLVKKLFWNSLLE